MIKQFVVAFVQRDLSYIPIGRSRTDAKGLGRRPTNPPTLQLSVPMFCLSLATGSAGFVSVDLPPNSPRSTIVQRTQSTDLGQKQQLRRM